MDLLRKAAASFWVRLLVTLALLAIVALQVDWDAAGDRLSGGRWSWFALAVGLLVLSLGAGGLRWHLLLQAARVPVSAAASLRAFAIGVFSNNFLPTSFGGDAARAWIVGRSGPPLVRALTSVAVDRLTAIGVLLTLADVAVLAEPDSVPDSLKSALGLVSFGGFVAVVLGVLAMRGGGRLARRLPQRLQEWARESRGTLRGYWGDRGLALSVISLGVLFQGLVVAATWAITEALELDLSFALVAVAVPLVLVITLIPLSVAGFGIREGGFVLVLGEAGVSATDATLVSLLSVAALALSSLPGAIAMVLPYPAGDAPPD